MECIEQAIEMLQRDALRDAELASAPVAHILLHEGELRMDEVPEKRSFGITLGELARVRRQRRVFSYDIIAPVDYYRLK